MVVCIYAGDCTSEGYKCEKCKHNTSKRDHYKPDKLTPRLYYPNPYDWRWNPEWDIWRMKKGYKPLVPIARC